MRGDQYDVIVIGSGFGGSVIAERLSAEGMDVCVLERGNKFPPGSFPRTPKDIKKSLWDPSRGLYGMFNLWSFKSIDSLVSSGLGGGSLIYANVLLRKDEKWFHETYADGSYRNWPVTRADLDPHYERVEKMLGAQKFPLQHEPYASTTKTVEFRDAADRLNLDWKLPNLAVSFSNGDETPQPGVPIEGEENLHRYVRQTCRLCGECDIGCNYGSKNTLDFNYLSAAKRHGAEIKTLCDVKSFRPVEAGYEVTYVKHSTDQISKHSTTHTITGKKLVLAAGTLGTNFLLLKNAPYFPGLNHKALGKKFCGNGDLLSFAYKCGVHTPNGWSSREINPNLGPVITSTVRMPDELDGTGTSRGFYIQDAGYPAFLSWILETSNPSRSMKGFLTMAWAVIKAKLSKDTDLGAEFSSLLGDTSASSGSLPLLGMGRDMPDGNFFLNDKNRLQSDWVMDESSDYFCKLKETMKDLTNELGGQFIVNPTWYLKRVITVHPVGGCSMSIEPEDGVTDAFGEVWNHPGLYIADGSVLPGPVGPNPSLTIAAIADRIASAIIEPTYKNQSSTL